MEKGSLFLIPSPIGNMNDVSPRIIDTINNCDLIACEDTRNTAKLLSILGISKTCVSCHEHNENAESKSIIDKILSGKNIGYLSDAGYPCISDPGFLLAKNAIENGITVVPISGPSAFLNAIVASGLDTSHFMFYGFLKSKETDRKKELETLKTFPYTIIFYESPHRIKDTLLNLLEVFGNRKITLAREISKVHEEFIRTDLESITQNKVEIKGEIVLILEGYTETETETLSNKEIENRVDILIKNGLNKKDAIQAVAILLNLNKNKVKSIYYNSINAN